MRKYIIEETQSDFSKLLYAIHARSSDGGFSELMDDDFDFDFLRDLASYLDTTLLCEYEAEDLFGGYLTPKSITNEYINPIIYKLLTCCFDESEFEIDAISGDSSSVANHILDKYYNDPNDSAAQSIAEDISSWFDVNIDSKEYIPIDEEYPDEAYGGVCIIRFSDKCDQELIRHLMEYLPFMDTDNGTWSSCTLGDYEGYYFRINLGWLDDVGELAELLETLPIKKHNEITSNVDKFINILDVYREDSQMCMGNDQMIEDVFQSFCSEMEVIL